MSLPNKLFISLLLLFSSSFCFASILKLEQVSPGIYAIIGELGNRSAKNLGNNASFGFIVTDKQVVLVDPGGTHKGAIEIHKIIKNVTSNPVTYVINTGGQDHRWLGNSYFKQQGATIIASKSAVSDQQARLKDQLFRLGNLMTKEELEGTQPVFADIQFNKEHKFNVDGIDIELHHPGQAHTPGDSFVWLPKSKVLFSGDIVYTQRMLSISDVSGSNNWMLSFEAMASYNPLKVIPGHGKVTTLEVARKDTYDYLKTLRERMRVFMENGGDITQVNKVNQSEFKYLLNFDMLSGRNAQRVYSELEFE